jgi:hypothetical protein
VSTLQQQQQQQQQLVPGVASLLAGLVVCACVSQVFSRPLHSPPSSCSTGKFSAVKIVVFATYYQSLLVAVIPGMDELGSSERWNDFILCIGEAWGGGGGAH